MRAPSWMRFPWHRKAQRRGDPSFRRDRLAMRLALVTAACLGVTVLLSDRMQFLMPGQLTSAHGGIEACGTCHTSSGSGKLSWLHGLVTDNRIADSKACLNCHRMPETALYSHGASLSVLSRSSDRLLEVATRTSAPKSAHVQDSLFPTHDLIARGLSCATCHKEHRGPSFNLKKIADQQCRSCHVVKFDSFDKDHPQFSSYPFRRRTRLIYDHAGHFGKHFPEMSQKNPGKHMPPTCATCHDTSKDSRVMAVTAFGQTCASCHLEQIVGKDRISGPKGIAFLTLPGLDLQTLRKRNIFIGEWPEEFEARLTPFMKLLISQTERGRDVIETVNQLDLQNLGGANDEEIKAVADLAWEIKALFSGLVTKKPSTVLVGLISRLSVEQLGADVLTDLTASLPRDTVMAAQQQWLPNLDIDMARRPASGSQKSTGWITTTATSAERSGPVGIRTASEPQETTVQPSATDSRRKPSASAGGAPSKKAAAGPRGVPSKKAADQTDDLLFPTPAELSAIKSGKVPQSSTSSAGPRTTVAAAGAAPAPAVTVPAGGDASAPEMLRRPSLQAVMKSDVEPENWAEFGGWYRQDHAVFYRPTGHKDRFLSIWLRLTGPLVSKGAKNPETAIFDALASRDAPGSCTKCHSVDALEGGGRKVNFSPLSADIKRGRFTRFLHEPHFAITDKRGCLTCHQLESGRAYLKGYEQDNAQNVVSGFGAVKKELCQTCHNSSMARQDCLTCHTYHIHGAVTPVMNTKTPVQ